METVKIYEAKTRLSKLVGRSRIGFCADEGWTIPGQIRKVECGEREVCARIVPGFRHSKFPSNHT